MPEREPLLTLEGVGVRLRGARRATHVLGGKQILDDVHLRVDRGQIVALIGETGSGKTTLARAIAGLVATTTGSIRFEDEEITHLSRRARRDFRRSGKVQFVFQDPLRSLDADHTVSWIVGEGLAIQGELDDTGRAAAVDAALHAVGLDPAIGVRRPDQISGGQRQRASIARAIVMRPSLMLCDEPVSALDASTRNYVLQILADLRRQLEVSLLIISHDLVSISGIADRVAVLYRGRIVEEGPVTSVFQGPKHPYTALLLASAPALGRRSAERGLDAVGLRRADDEATIENDADTPACAFATRCPFATESCWSVTPARTELQPGWTVACHHPAAWRERVPVS